MVFLIPTAIVWVSPNTKILLFLVYLAKRKEGYSVITLPLVLPNNYLPPQEVLTFSMHLNKLKNHHISCIQNFS